jgi:flagellar motor switch/type III secretory pathway protein FliN
MAQVSDWLPVGATAHKAVQAKIGAAVAAWSAQWFARRSLVATGFTPTMGEAAAEADGWRIYREAVAVSRSPRAAGRLLDWALDASLEQSAVGRRDRQLVDAFERRMIEDLAARVEAALGGQGAARPAPSKVDAPHGPMGGLVVGVGEDGGGKLLSLAIPLAAVLPACKAALGPASRNRPGLDSLVEAFGDARLTIEAVLGSADIRLADLRTLAPGDVLVLNTGLAEAADLLMAGSGRAVARAALTDIEGRMALTLQA